MAGLIAALLTWAVATGGPLVLRVDVSVTDTTRAWADALAWPTDLAAVIGQVTAPFWSFVAASVLWLALLRTRHVAAGALLALSGLLGVTTSEVLKTLMGRQRPPAAVQHVADLDRSFPSGHAMEGIYLYVAAGLILVHLGRAGGRRLLGSLGVALVIAGPIIGLSRIVLGVHWPSDVVVGWAYGSLVLLVASLLLWGPVDRGWAPPGPGRAGRAGRRLTKPAAPSPSPRGGGPGRSRADDPTPDAPAP